MINVFHLLWIIPIASAFGFMFATILAVSKDVDEWERNNKR